MVLPHQSGIRAELLSTQYTVSCHQGGETEQQSSNTRGLKKDNKSMMIGNSGDVHNTLGLDSQGDVQQVQTEEEICPFSAK